MKDLIEYVQSQIYGFVHPKVQALLLERSLLDQTLLLAQAQAGFAQSPPPKTVQAYKRGVSSMGEQRLPEEVYSYGFTEAEYNSNQFELDLIAAQRACFRFENPFYQNFFGQAEIFGNINNALPLHVELQTQYLNHNLKFLFLRPIIQLHLQKSYRFGIAGIHLSGVEPSDYAAVISQLPEHPYASSVVCIAEKLYYLDKPRQCLIEFEHPALLALFKANKAGVNTSFDEFPNLFAAIGASLDPLKSLKTKLSKAEADFLAQLKQLEADLKQKKVKLDELLAKIYPSYLAYQNKINDIMGEIAYPQDYLQDIQLMPLSSQLFYAPTFFPVDDFTAEEQAAELQLYIGDLILSLAAVEKSFTQQQASFALSLNQNEFATYSDVAGLKAYLAQNNPEIDEYKQRVKTWYMGILGYSEETYQAALLKDELSLFTVYNVVIGRMQILKQTLFASLINRGLEPAQYAQEIKGFERFAMSALQRVVHAYLSGDLQKNQHFITAATHIKQQKGDAVLDFKEQVGLQYFMPAFAVLPLQVIDASLQEGKKTGISRRLQAALIATSLVIAATVVFTTVGGNIPLIVGSLLFVGAAAVFWQMRDRKNLELRTKESEREIELTEYGHQASPRPSLDKKLQNEARPKTVRTLWSKATQDASHKDEPPSLKP